MTKICNIFMYLKRYCRILVLSAALLITFTPPAQSINFGASYDRLEYLQYCSAEKYAEKYSRQSCWSCEIIDAMFDGMKTAVVKIYKKIQPLCLLILPLGFAIWLAMYLLKALGSFATQEAGKLLDGIMISIFKVSLVYVIISLGVNELVQDIVTPFLSIGMDIGNGFVELAEGAF